MQLHYRTLFTLQRSKSASEERTLYQIAIHQIGVWLNQHLRANQIEESCINTSLFKGCKTSFGGIFIETRTLKYNEASRTAEYWALKFDHPDGAYNNRIWRTDIAIYFEDDHLANVIITVGWFLNNNFIGNEPPLPSISAPRIVRYFLTNDEIDCLADGYEFDQSAKKLEVGDGRDLHRHIVDSERKLPIILVNTTADTALIDANRIQSLLLGNAFVYWYNTVDVHEELTFQWGKNSQLNTSKDSVRIYRAWSSSKHPLESKVHPFFLFKNYVLDPEILFKIIVNSLYRSLSSSYVGDRVKDISSLYSLNRSLRLDELRIASESTGHSTPQDVEYFHALAEENYELIERNEQLEEYSREQERVNSNLILDLEIANDEIKRIQNDFSEVSSTQSHYLSAVKGLDNIRAKLERLPRNPHDVLVKIAHLYPDKLQILQEAIDSAREADFDDTNEIWDLLISMVKHLPELHFERDSVNVEREFRSTTGFSLTLKESSQTKADNRLMELRKRVYEEREVDISAHTKLDKNGKNFRIHYYPDNLRKLIVIGHFGNHMETAGTKRRKEG